MLAALVAAIAVSSAHAEEKPPPDLGAYSPAHPTPDDKLRDLCADRPTKGTSACTVEPGRWQLEADLFNGAFERRHGVTTDTWLAANPTLKLGITDRLDLEANLPPVEIVRTHDRGAGTDTSVNGIGDLVLRAKYALVGNGGAALAIAIAPYIKLPTARHAIGNGAVEGGLLLPVSANLPAGFSLNLVTEADVLANDQGGGRHLQTVNLAGVTHPVGGGVNASAELWSQVDFDPAGRSTQVSLDLGLAWIPKSQPNLQLDGGVNLGLNRATPGVQVYAGVSRRF